MDISEWIEPQVLITWDALIPTPAELCDCQNDFPFGEEQDDGSYLADAYSFSLTAEVGKVIRNPEADWYWFFVTLRTTAHKQGQVTKEGRTLVAFPVPDGVYAEGALDQVGRILWDQKGATCQRVSTERQPTFWVVEISFNDGSTQTVQVSAKLEMDPYEPYGVLCHCPPMDRSSVFVYGPIGWDETGCKATPYVAEGLKVTGWLDGVAEMAMGFLPCGGAVVLIKRYWMGQEVGWLECSDAVLSCIPYLGKIGGLALRGFAGAAKWFLRSRKLRHLAEGKEWIEKARRLGRRVAKGLADHEPGSCGVVSQSQRHHIATDKYRRRDPKWTEKFERLFKEAGMSLQDPDNLVYLPNHTGPHPPNYHEWVYNNLLDALQGRQTMAEKQHALKERLEKIRQWLLENPDKLNSGEYPGLLR